MSNRGPIPDRFVRREADCRKEGLLICFSKQQEADMADGKLERSIGLLGATGVGVGAIVGGGVLALAGVAFETAGPGAIVAFALNGFVAVLTALSFAEMSSAFPESGGT